MDVPLGRVVTASDVKFNNTILFHEFLKIINSASIVLESAEECSYDPPSPIMSRYIKPFKSIELPPTSRIVSYDDSDDDFLLPPPEIQESIPTSLNIMVLQLKSNIIWSCHTANSWTGGCGKLDSNISIAMITETGAKPNKIAVNEDDSEQCKEVMAKEMALQQSNGVLTCVQKVPSGATMIESRWVMGRKLLANGQSDEWKVNIWSRRRSKHGDYNAITSPVIHWESFRLALGLAEQYDLERSAMTPVPVRNTQVMQMALMALTEPRHL
jgi:hypothetical protein